MLLKICIYNHWNKGTMHGLLQHKYQTYQPKGRGIRGGEKRGKKGGRGVWNHCSEIDKLEYLFMKKKLQKNRKESHSQGQMVSFSYTQSSQSRCLTLEESALMFMTRR